MKPFELAEAPVEVDAVGALPSLLRPSAVLRRIEENLFSALPEAEAGAPYDRKARVYDLLVGSALYNRIAWGTSPLEYQAFARAAAASSEGWMLELAAGSCLASAAAYTETRRPVLVVDRSLAMLRRARDRLAGPAGARPNVVFLQADLFALPFEPGQATTVLALGALHVVDDAAGFLRAMHRHRRPGGQLWLTSLVRGRRLSSWWLAHLHARGEVARPRTLEELSSLAEATLGEVSLRTRGAMAYLQA